MFDKPPLERKPRFWHIPNVDGALDQSLLRDQGTVGDPGMVHCPIFEHPNGSQETTIGLGCDKCRTRMSGSSVETVSLVPSGSHFPARWSNRISAAAVEHMS
jgi:hypothetical protein